MYLKRFIFVNWGNVPNGEFDFGPVNLFSGASGSGKTTAADAIQTIMTAAKSNLFNYNPGQDETTQKGKGGKQVRTLSSYVLGCDDGSFARMGLTDGYLAAHFYPTKNESGEPFVALIGVRADLDSAGRRQVAREIDTRFFILPYRHELISIDDFIQGEPAEVIPLEKITAYFRACFGHKGVEEYTTKKAYLTRLYGQLRGKLTSSLSEREANAGARAFSRFMAYKPVASINEFVGSEILDKKDLGEAIDNISSMMKTINAMEKDARRINESVLRLNKANTEAMLYIDNWIKLNALTLTREQAHFNMEQSAYLKEKKRQQVLTEDIKANDSAIGQIKAQIEQYKDRAIDLQAQRRGYDQLREKDALLKSIERIKTNMVDSVKTLLTEDFYVKKNIQAGKQLFDYLGDKNKIKPSELDCQEGKKLSAQVAKSVAWKQLDYQQLLTQDWVDIKPFQEFLDPAEKTQAEHQALWHYLYDSGSGAGTLIDRLRRMRDNSDDHYQNLLKQRKLLETEIERLERSNKVRYPNHVTEAVKAIQRAVPGCQPKILCDFVEVEEERWQSAIEGYLGGNRYSIIVEAEFEAQAIAIVRSMKQKNHSKVIQGEKAKEDALRLTPSTDSIIAVMSFSHKVAEHYLCASYGNVVRVENADALKQTRRGLTPDSLGSGNYAMFRCDIDDSDLVFGKAARDRALLAKQERLSQCLIEAEQSKNLYEYNASLVAALDDLKPLSIAEEVVTLLNHYRKVQSIQDTLADMDLSEFEQLESTIKAVEAKADELNRELEVRLKQNGTLENKLSSSVKKLELISTSQEELEGKVATACTDLEQIAKMWSELDADKMIEQAKAQAKNCDYKQLEKHDIKSVFEVIGKNRFSLIHALREHNQVSHSIESIPITLDVSESPNLGQFAKICAMQSEIDRVLVRLRANVLIEKQDQISKLKLTFDNTFVDHLCGAIYHSVKEGERILTELNQELQKHQFGQEKETYRFHWEFLPDFKEYWDFFEEVRKYPVGDGSSLFDRQFDKKRFSKIRDKILSMLLDEEDEMKAQKELERIADYRNYRNYEIFKEVPGKEPIALSQYGTGSGGQLETPAYIIRAAAITSALQYSQPGSHLRMVLVDEAFSKMDEDRSRSVINYLTESLGLQLIFIMPSKASGPFLDMISNQFIFAKYPLPSGQKRGQLKTAVYVDRKAGDIEQIKQLWSHHKKTIYDQANLDFMEDIVAAEEQEKQDAMNDK